MMFDPSRTLSLDSLPPKSGVPEPVFRHRKRPRDEGLRKGRRSRSRSSERTRARLSSPDSSRNGKRLHPSRRSISPRSPSPRREERSPLPDTGRSYTHRATRGRLSASPPPSLSSAGRSRASKQEPHSPSRSTSLEEGQVRREEPAYSRKPSSEKARISHLKQDIWDARSDKRAAHAREMRAVRELIRLGERVPPAADHRWEEDALNAELTSMAEALERERRKRTRADRELAGMKAAYDTPFLVPALLEAFMEINKLTEHEPCSTKIAHTRSGSRSWQET